MKLTSESQKLLQTLTTWRCLWDKTTSRLSENERMRLGVAHIVSDLAYLTRKIVEIASAGDAAASTSRYLRRIPSYGTGTLHEFIREFITK